LFSAKRIAHIYWPIDTLQTLDLFYWSPFWKLPTSIYQFITLQTLCLSECFQLKELPTSIG
jgi:hypothetical protein